MHSGVQASVLTKINSISVIAASSKRHQAQRGAELPLHSGETESDPDGWGKAKFWCVVTGEPRWRNTFPLKIGLFIVTHKCF